MIPLKARLRAARESVGMSQASVARSLGITRGAVSQWETGESAPGAQHFRALSSLYRVDVIELMRAEEPVSAAGVPCVAATDDHIGRDEGRDAFEELRDIWRTLTAPSREELLDRARALHQAQTPADLIDNLNARLAGLSAEDIAAATVAVETALRRRR